MSSRQINATHEWRSLQDFRKGDSVHSWDRDMEVTNIKVMKKSVEISYMHDGKEKRIVGSKLEEYIARKR